jgi:hypothetical protein
MVWEQVCVHVNKQFNIYYLWFVQIWPVSIKKTLQYVVFS